MNENKIGSLGLGTTHERSEPKPTQTSPRIAGYQARRLNQSVVVLTKQCVTMVLQYTLRYVYSSIAQPCLSPAPIPVGTVNLPPPVEPGVCLVL